MVNSAKVRKHKRGTHVNRKQRRKLASLRRLGLEKKDSEAKGTHPYPDPEKQPLDSISSEDEENDFDNFEGGNQNSQDHDNQDREEDNQYNQNLIDGNRNMTIALENIPEADDPINPNLQMIFEAKILKDLDTMLFCQQTIEATNTEETVKLNSSVKNIALLINSHPDLLSDKDIFYGRKKTSSLIGIPPSSLYEKMVMTFFDKKFKNLEQNPNGYFYESICRSSKEKTQAKWNTFNEW